MGDIGVCSNPVTKSNITSMLASGYTQTEVANQLGVSRMTISRAAKKPDIKALIEQTHQDIIQQALQPTKQALIHLTTNYLTTALDPDTNKPIRILDAQDRDHAHKLQVKLLESTGIFSSNNQSILIQNILNQVNFDLPEPVKRVFAQVSHNDLVGGYLEDTEPGITYDMEDNGPVTPATTTTKVTSD
jgi:hypothetical protein